MTPRSIVPSPPRPGQESVWQYPRPPRIESSTRHVVVVLGGEVVAETTRALRVLETSQPPVYYIPPGDYRRACFRPTANETFCEFKGVARYFDLVVGERAARQAAWAYASPATRYAVLRDYVGIIRTRGRLLPDGDPVRGQEGGFYGGWIERDVVGPFKEARGWTAGLVAFCAGRSIGRYADTPRPARWMAGHPHSHSVPQA
jgi:uncharacterized protein (DUF427 family)